MIQLYEWLFFNVTQFYLLIRISNFTTLAWIVPEESAQCI